MIDADNAFNRLNRTVAMLNIRYTCPAYAKVLINCYRAAAVSASDCLLNLPAKIIPTKIC